jgi:hypothetical protein
VLAIAGAGRLFWSGVERGEGVGAASASGRAGEAHEVRGWPGWGCGQGGHGSKGEGEAVSRERKFACPFLHRMNCSPAVMPQCSARQGQYISEGRNKADVAATTSIYPNRTNHISSWHDPTA